MIFDDFLAYTLDLKKPCILFLLWSTMDCGCHGEGRVYFPLLCFVHSLLLDFLP